MATKVDTMELFISACEIEHPDNGESFTREDKIRAAVERQLRKKDPDSEFLRIFLDSKMRFCADPLGYNVIIRVIK